MITDEIYTESGEILGSYKSCSNLENVSLPDINKLYEGINPDIIARTLFAEKRAIQDKNKSNLIDEDQRIINQAKSILRAKRNYEPKEPTLFQKIILWIKQLFGYKQPENEYLQKQLFEELY